MAASGIASKALLGSLLLFFAAAPGPAPRPQAAPVRTPFREQCLESALPLIHFLESGEWAGAHIPSALPAGFLARMRKTAGPLPQGNGSDFRALRLFPAEGGSGGFLGMQIEFGNGQRKWTFYARWKNAGGTALLHDLVYSGEKGFLLRVQREGGQEVLYWREEPWYSMPWMGEREFADSDSFRDFKRKIQPRLLEEIVPRMDRAVDPEWPQPGPLPADPVVIWADPDCSFNLISWLLLNLSYANIGSVELVDEKEGRTLSFPTSRGFSENPFPSQATLPMGSVDLEVDAPGLPVLDPETGSSGCPGGRWHLFPGRRVVYHVHPDDPLWIQEDLERGEFLSRVEKYPDKKVFLDLGPGFGVLYSEVVCVLGDLRDRGYEYSLVGGSQRF